jgi:hypothetical protein
MPCPISTRGRVAPPEIAIGNNDPELIADLTGVEYGYALKDGRDAIQLERKSDMRRRGLASPDNADALALTFAYPVAPSDHTYSHGLMSQHRLLRSRITKRRRAASEMASVIVGMTSKRSNTIDCVRFDCVGRLKAD